MQEIVDYLFPEYQHEDALAELEFLKSHNEKPSAELKARVAKAKAAAAADDATESAKKKRKTELTQTRERVRYEDSVTFHLKPTKTRYMQHFQCDLML